MPLPAESIDVGKIKLVWRGAYNGSTAYEIDDIVQYDDGISNSSYICVADSTGNAPSTAGSVNTTYWNLMVQGGSAISGGIVNGSIQYKNSTGFGATSILLYNSSTSKLGVGTTNPTATLTVVGLSTFSSGISAAGITTFAGGLNINGEYNLLRAHDKVLVVAGAANGTSNIDVKTSNTVLFTSNSTATWTHNIRGDASTSLDSLLSDGQSITVTVISAQNNSSYYTANITIDGAAQTEYWCNTTSAPTSGKSSGYDIYTFIIIKTGSATFFTLASKAGL